MFECAVCRVRGAGTHRARTGGPKGLRGSVRQVQAAENRCGTSKAKSNNPVVKWTFECFLFDSKKKLFDPRQKCGTSPTRANLHCRRTRNYRQSNERLKKLNLELKTRTTKCEKLRTVIRDLCVQFPASQDRTGLHVRSCTCSCRPNESPFLAAIAPIPQNPLRLQGNNCIGIYTIVGKIL